MMVKKKKRSKENLNFRLIYWLSVFFTLLALIFLVREVLQRAKTFIVKEIEISPMFINWQVEDDNTLLIKEPYYLESKYKLASLYSSIKKDTAIYNSLVNGSASITDLEKPYLLWKNKNSDTVYIIKNEVKMFFLPKN